MPQKNSYPDINLLEPGTLWSRLKQSTEHALNCGALQPIPTDYEFVEQGGIPFLVRTLANLERKQAAKQLQEEKSAQTGRDINPFLPYEEDLFVADLSESHLCLLNKFNVVDHHLLIVTREFEEQENWLNFQDFEALWRCLAEIDGLAFYNAGKVAGASQRHKHLQLVPLPITPEGERLPIEKAIAATQFQSAFGTSPQLPFKHAIAPLDIEVTASPQQQSEATLVSYQTLLNAVGFSAQTPVPRSPQPYNLLMTREWMLMVPRSQEDFETISVNSLGFAGTLLVKNNQQMQRLKALGPLNLLKAVAQ